MAITNCLNFGNPKRPEVFHQFREAVGGMADACKALGTPVTGGNVSFYNESPTGTVFPTPTIGMVGLLEDVDQVTPSGFVSAGDSIVLLGECTAELGASEYLSRIHSITAGAPPACDLDAERRLIDALHATIQQGLVRSAHDVSDGGLAVALAECCIGNRVAILGASIDLSSWDGLPLRALLFGEAQGRVIVSTDRPNDVERVAQSHGVPARVIGRVTEDGAPLSIRVGAREFSGNTRSLAAAFHEAIPRLMTRVATAAESPDTALASSA
jgi:phosphoribosylformylglycinamidine synthase